MQKDENMSKKAVVRAIRKGHHGPFFLAECDIGMVSVSLEKPVWEEDHWPEGAITVVISDIRRKQKGWRAYKARFLRPGDEELPKKEDQEKMEEEMAEMDNEARRKRIETLVKWGIAFGVAIVISPLVFLAIKGVAGLVIAGALGFTVIQFAPVFAMKIANQKMKMIVNEAENNPIETMKNLRIEKEEDQSIKHKEIVDFETEILNFNDDVFEFKQKYPTEAPAYDAISTRMARGLDKMKGDYDKATEDLAALVEAIEKAEAMYKMAQAVERVTKLSQSVEQRVFADIKQKVAFDAVRSQVNRSFAALNNSVGQRSELRSQATFALPGVGAKMEVSS